MYIADALSRSYLKDAVQDYLDLAYCVHSLSANLSITDEKRIRMQKSVLDDPSLSLMKKYLETGQFPTNIKSLPGDLKMLLQLKNDIVLSEGLLFYIDRLIIPERMKAGILVDLHTGHFGVEKIFDKAKKNFYWMNMKSDIADYISRCKPCQTYQRSNCKEPLHPHPLVDRPWEKVAIDFFFCKGLDWLVVIDSYSNWIEVAKMKSKTIKDAKKMLLSIFTRNGFPDIVFSDNSPFDSYEFKHSPGIMVFLPKLLVQGIPIAMVWLNRRRNFIGLDGIS